MVTRLRSIFANSGLLPEILLTLKRCIHFIKRVEFSDGYQFRYDEYGWIHSREVYILG